MKKTISKKSTGAAKKAAPKAKTLSRPVPPPPIKKSSAATRPGNSRTNSYTQSEFLENVRSFCGLAKRSQAREVCEDLARFITDSLRKGYKLPLLGLGKMYVRQTKARTGRNPATGEIIQIAPKKRVRFAAAKSLKEAVL